MNAADLDQQIATWHDPADGASMKSHELILMLLRTSEQPFSRDQFAPGHITGTGLVLHPKRNAVLLVHHKRLNRWLLPGGHVEAEDATIFDSARREVSEETAVSLDQTHHLIGLDVHGIPGNTREPYHLHHDIVVAFQAVEDQIVVSEESRAVAWCGFDELDRYQVPDNVRRCLGRI